MPKTVVYDTLNLEGADIQVDLASGTVFLLARYNIAPSQGGAAMAKQRDVSGMLTTDDRTFVLRLTQRLKKALEAQELV